MSQINRHLTTEQLSTLLDNKLYEIPTDEPLDAIQYHLDCCEQCQQVYADLRQTVNLLHTLPQPVLPRSFALPSDFSLTQMDAEEEFELSNGFEDEDVLSVPPISLEQTRQSQRNRPVRTATLPSSLRSTMRIISALAAMIGICLALSGLLGHMGMSAATSTSSGAAANAPANAHMGKNEKPLTPETAGTSIKKHPNASAVGRTTPTPTAVSSVQSAPYDNHEISSSPQILPNILFFDLNTPAGRLGLGILLAIFGSMGFTLFKQRYRSQTSSRK
ncbi:anti-sigma factor family protein [Dictyobacter arantiisoli]|uniref:Zinc-finger domain-containing protein n=1 Tax=Dictyobacter arantiisoli TaxID=2014874 RepID=A0A5A5TH80_9CHLR|nr:hypothetical protein [Dictyobacter arantiisoli]GCF10506.1 hypothetical protein KDI_40700 [Dictyobacter arantiisoli]